MASNPEDLPKVLSAQQNWSALYFYQKSDVVYQLTFAFCDRYIDRYKDRTRDQMIQAARSCKQNIVEGLADGVASSEMQLKLLNVARASLKELREDYEDYLKSRRLRFYAPGDGRYDAMLQYCRKHNMLADYEPYFRRWTDEEMCNCALTLCHMIDRMMVSFLKRLEEQFVTEGGIKERMHRARTGYRQLQDQQLREAQEELVRMRAALSAAQSDAQRWKSAYEDLKRRALKAYTEQQQEIQRLKETVRQNQQRRDGEEKSDGL